MINPQYYSQDLNVYSSHCLPYISYFCLEFNIFPELSRTSSLVRRLPSPGKCENTIQDFPWPVRTLFNNSKRCCIDRLIFRSKQNCESLTYCTLQAIVMIDYSGLEKFKSQQKNPFQSCELKLFRSAENFIDIGECTKTLSLLNVLVLQYLRMVQHICSEFLADMPNVSAQHFVLWLEL